MTYDWNKQVEITVPTGTNGWIYSGEVIINGVKVRFPVGVPTTVPEPAAALLNKMIELEREDENNTAKPDNHYVGNVTIPEGKTLTLAKGAKVVDEDGVLGGSSTPAPVVILPETELTLSDDGVPVITSPWEVEPAVGGVYKVNFNGVDYMCDGLLYSVDGAPFTGVVMGNSDALSGMIPDAPHNEAPFILLCLSNVDGENYGFYGMVDCVSDLLPITLSIVQTEGESDGGGGIYMVTATITDASSETSMRLEFDKTFDEVKAAAMAGQHPICRVELNGEGDWTDFPIVRYNAEMLYFALFVDGMHVGVNWNPANGGTLDVAT